MAAMEPLYFLAGINSQQLTNKERILLELLFFTRLCEELEEMFRKQQDSYFQSMKFTIEKDNTMLETNFARFVIQDILATEEYNLTGVALYSNTTEDVLQEIFSGRVKHPSALLLRKIMELHRMVRRDLYQKIMKKIIGEQFKK